MGEVLIGEGPVLLEVDQAGVARVRLNRPEAANGMNVELLRALHEAIMRWHGVRGCGWWCSAGWARTSAPGGDVRTFASKGAALPDYLREATSWLQLATAALVQLGAPVIAQVQGFAAGGGGFGLVCAADLVVAAESAKFFSGAVRVGMAPDAGTTVTLTQLVGLRQALRILLTNPTLTAAEARDLGVVTEVVPDDELPGAGGRAGRGAGPVRAAGAWPRPSGWCGRGWAPPWPNGCPRRPARCRSCPARPTPGRGWRR